MYSSCRASFILRSAWAIRDYWSDELNASDEYHQFCYNSFTNKTSISHAKKRIELKRKVSLTSSESASSSDAEQPYAKVLRSSMPKDVKGKKLHSGKLLCCMQQINQNDKSSRNLKE